MEIPGHTWISEIAAEVNALDPFEKLLRQGLFDILQAELHMLQIS